MQRLHPRPEPRSEGRRPSRPDRPPADRLVGGARRERRDRRPSAPEEPRRARTTGIDAYALYTAACVAAMGLDDPAARRPHRAPRGVRGRRRGRRLGPRPRRRPGRRSSAGSATSSSRRMRRGSTRRSSTPRRRSSGTTSRRPSLRLQWQYQVTESREVAGHGRAARRRGRSTTASTARTRSSRRSSTGSRTTTSRYRSQFPIPNVPKLVNSFVLEELDGRPDQARDARAAAAVGEGPGDPRGRSPRCSTRPSGTGWSTLKVLVEADCRRRADGGCGPPRSRRCPGAAAGTCASPSPAARMMSIRSAAVRRPVRGATERPDPHEEA